MDGKSNSYHLRLINSVLGKVKSWDKTFNFPKLKIIPQKWPSGETFPTLLDICQNLNYYSVNNIWMSREEIIGSNEMNIATQLDADLATLEEECDAKYLLLSNKYL